MTSLDNVRPFLDKATTAGGANEETIRAAENRLGIRFPPSYRLFLSNYGASVGGGFFEIAGLSNERDDSDEPPLFSSVVTATLQIREASKGHLPNALIQIADDGMDYKFYLDTEKPGADGECPVISLGPGTDGIVIANNVFDFILRSAEKTLRY